MMAKQTGLEMLVESNIYELSNGIPWVLIGKVQTTRGYKKWEAVVLYEDDDDELKNREARLLLQDDPSAILVNGYDNAWIGCDGEGGHEPIKEVARRIKNGYGAGWCKTSWVQILLMANKEIVERVLKSTDETAPYMPEAEKAEWQEERAEIIDWLKSKGVKNVA